MSDSPATFLDGRVVLHAGDCVEVMAGLPEASVDAVVTDPPYHLTSIVKRFGGKGAAPAKSNGATGVYGRAAKGFMGKTWDGGRVAFEPETWAAALRVLKPGGHLLAFSAPRCVHRMGVAIEDAGFEIRDRLLEFVASDAAARAFIDTLSEAQADAFLECVERSGFGGELAWVFGSGFPKSHDISKAIDKMLGAAREKVKKDDAPAYQRSVGNMRPWMDDPDHMVDGDEPATPEGAEWQGWGTALKAAYEPIIMARKPLAEGSVAVQVLKTGTGALNIDGCRIEAAAGDPNARDSKQGTASPGYEGGFGLTHRSWDAAQGRWPANLLHDGSDEVVACFLDTKSGQLLPTHDAKESQNGAMSGKNYVGRIKSEFGGDSGSAARFFYTAKADGDDRLGSKHPTVKPVDLMQWLVRLVCRKGGTVLDPFAGTGTTGEAAFREGCNAVLIEREAEYREDIARRMKLALAGERERKVARLEARGIPSIEESPLFGALGQEGGE